MRRVLVEVHGFVYSAEVLGVEVERRGRRCITVLRYAARVRWPCPRLRLPELVVERAIIPCTVWRMQRRPPRWLRRLVEASAAALAGCRATRPCSSVYRRSSRGFESMLKRYMERAGGTPRPHLVGFTVHGEALVYDRTTGLYAVLPPRPCNPTSTAASLLAALSLGDAAGEAVYAVVPAANPAAGERSDLLNLVQEHVAYTIIEDAKLAGFQLKVRTVINVASEKREITTTITTPSFINVNPIKDYSSHNLHNAAIRSLKSRELVRLAEWIAESWKKHLTEVELSIAYRAQS